MCRIIGASKSGFYRWMKAQWGYVSPYEKYLLFWIKITHERSKGRYGSRRVFWALRSQGIICYLNQIARIMKNHGIKAAQIAAIGDHINDVQMIEGAGCGIAMGNAVAEVKTVAKRITADNNQAGVAWAIDQLLEGVW